MYETTIKEFIKGVTNEITHGIAEGWELKTSIDVEILIINDNKFIKVVDSNMRINPGTVHRLRLSLKPLEKKI
jgi:hypothetical protein